MMRAIVAPIDDARAFLEEWRALRPYPTLFLSDAWIGALLDIWPRESQRYAVRVDGAEGAPRLLGLIGRGQRRHPLALRAPRLNEADHEAVDRVYIEFNDFLCREGDDAARGAALSAIADAFSNDDELIFRNATPSLAAAIARRFEAPEFSVATLREAPTFEVDLKAAPAFSKSLSRKISIAEKSYAERGPLTIARIAPGAEFDAAFARMAQLHGDAWRRRGEAGVFVNPRLIAFHEALRRRAPEMAELFEVRAGDCVIAALYNLVFDGFAANYQSGFQFESDNRLAPGFLAHAFAIDHYRSRGFASYSFLAGDAEYKRRLGVEGPMLKTMVVARSTWRRRVRRLVRQYGARRAAKTRQT